MANETQEEFLSCISKGTIQEIYFFLMKNEVGNIMHIRGKDSYTVLHFLAQTNKMQTVEFIMRYSKDHYGTLYFKELENWVNAVSHEEHLTCTHLAILRGNLDLVNIFLSFGAKIETRTRIGMTAVHLAAKSDQILILSWLRNKDHDVECVDNLNNTPLHYSSMHCCEFATAVLLSWKVKVNVFNNKNESPLFLAVQALSQRIVRSLLLRGADVACRDVEGKSVLDVAIEKGNSEIEALIRPPGLLSVCGIKPPQRPIVFRRMLMSLYLTLLAAGIFSMFFVLELADRFYSILTGLELVFLVIACWRDPGYIPNQQEHVLFDLARTVECYQICPECVIRRPPRSRHCQCCNKCVEKFDHHCPWINNCIGGRNIGVFYCFLVVTFTFVCYSGYICGVYTVKCFNGPDFVPDFKFFLALVWVLVPLSFLFPILLLLSVQTKNLLSNTTTNERYSRRIDANKVERTDSDEQVDRESVFRNVWDMCCNSRVQEYKNKNNTGAGSESVTRYSNVLKDYELSQKFLSDNSRS